MAESVFSIQEFVEIIFLMAALFSVIYFLVFTIHWTRKSTLMTTYIIGQGLIVTILGLFLYIKLSVTKSSTIFNFVLAILLSFMTYFFVSFAYQYFSQKDLTGKQIAILSLIPFVAMVALGFNIYFVQLITDERLIDILNMFVAMIILLIFIRGILYFYQYRSIARRSFKMGQSMFFIISFIKPLAIMVMIMFYIAGKDPFFLISILPLMFISIHYVGVHFQLLDDIPKLLDYIIENMKDGIVIVDESHYIIDYNEEFFEELFDINHCDNLSCLMKQFYEIVVDKSVLEELMLAVERRSNETFLGEMEIIKDQQLYRYNYNVSRVQDYKERYIGMMITFHDITEIQELYQAIEEKNRVLMRVNQQLESHMKNVNQLYVEEERKQLMDEINDTLGHSMTEVLALLELAVLMIDKSNKDEDIIKVLEDTTDRARRTLEEIRVSVARYSNN